MYVFSSPLPLSSLFQLPTNPYDADVLYYTFVKWLEKLGSKPLFTNKPHYIKYVNLKACRTEAQNQNLGVRGCLCLPFILLALLKFLVG